MFRYLPEQASDFAYKVDWIHHWITDISVFFTVLIFGAAVYFAIRYRRRDGQDHATPRIEGDHRLEVLWTLIPTLVCIWVATEGVLIYNDMRTPPKETIDIQVTGRSWAWDFQYKNGKKTTGELTVPVNKAIRLVMRSNDVLHSFFIPAMRVKNDVLPSMYSQLWFRPIKTGTYRVFCTEYCGKDHSAMLASLHVVSDSEYERWVEDRSEEYQRSLMEPGKVGAALYAKNCKSCHTLDGAPLVGPTFKGLWGKEETLSDGTKVVVDENYLKDSILLPAKQIVQGFPNAMTPFQGILSNDDVSALIAFLKNLDQYANEANAPAKSNLFHLPDDDGGAAAAANANLSPEERGKKAYTEKTCNTCHSIDGSRLVGPSFKGLLGRAEKLADGSTVTVDEDFIVRSIKDPNSQITEGYPPAMPNLYSGGLVNDEDIKDLIAFIKTLK
jgi:cytochrome c oxidase subunit 2